MPNYRERQRRMEDEKKAIGAYPTAASTPARPSASSPRVIQDVLVLAHEKTPSADRRSEFQHPCPANTYGRHDCRDKNKQDSPEWLHLRKVLAYEEVEGHEDIATRILADGLACYHQVGDADSSLALPRFANPELSACYLTRTCE